jgi:hypothetical protein
LFTVDQTAPTPTVNSQTTNDSTPTVTGTTNDSTDSVLVKVNEVEYSATVAENGDWSADISDTLDDGTYTVFVSSTDLASNTGETEGDLTVDTEVPNLTLDPIVANATTITGSTDPDMIVSVSVVDSELNGFTYEAVVDEAGLWSASIIDVLDENLYTVTVTSTDELGNKAEIASNLLIDITSPVITLLGDDPQTVILDSAYTELGANVTDNLDSSPTLTIDSSAVNVSTVGSYNVLYDAVDEAGNSATQVARMVNVVDTTAPVITLLGDSPLNLALGQEFVDPGAEALDNVDGDISANVEVTGTVDTETIGSYELHYNVSDTAGNSATEVIRTVVVSDLVIGSESNSTPTTNSVTINWTTSHLATSRVIYDTVSHDPITEAGPNYGYATSTVEDSTFVTAHSVTVTGLSEGTTYFFRPVSHGSPEVVGSEITASTGTTPPPSTGGGGGGSSGGSSGGGTINWCDQPGEVEFCRPLPNTTQTSASPLAPLATEEINGGGATLVALNEDTTASDNLITGITGVDTAGQTDETGGEELSNEEVSPEDNSNLAAVGASGFPSGISWLWWPILALLVVGGGYYALSRGNGKKDKHS